MTYFRSGCWDAVLHPMGCGPQQRNALLQILTSGELELPAIRWQLLGLVEEAEPGRSDR